MSERCILVENRSSWNVRHWKDIGMVTCRKHLQAPRLPSRGCEGKAGILAEHSGGYNLGFIMLVLPQLVLINVNCL